MTTDKLLVKHAHKRQKPPKIPKSPKTYKLQELTTQQREALDWYLDGVGKQYGLDSVQYRKAKSNIDYILIRHNEKIRRQKKVLKQAGRVTVRVIDTIELHPDMYVEKLPEGTDPEKVRRYNRELETLFKQYKKRR
jgi:hypothetical protein